MITQPTDFTRKVCRIRYDGRRGWAIAWRVDNYWDLHFQPDGEQVDIEPIDECLPSLAACRHAAEIWRPFGLERLLGI